MERRKFTREFKLEAVKLIQDRGVTVAQAARDLGVHGTGLRRWVQKCAADAQQAFPGQGQMKPEPAELVRLRREVIKLTAERDILKKAAVGSTDQCNTLWGTVEWEGDRHGTDGTSGLVCGPESRPVAAMETGAVGKRDRPGARRVWHDLLVEGIACGLHRIERLMRHAALRARPSRRRMPSDTGMRSTNAVAPNVLNRTFDAASANRKWVADFTYLWTAEGWLSVAAVVDLFSRRVVGWSMSATMTAQLVTDALVMAIWRRGTPHTVLHHSDRGSQYTSEPFQRLLADHGMTCSMSRAGNVWDNAVLESFFSSLKTERTAGKMYRTRAQAKADVFDYIECFYNPRRRHSTLGYLSPMEFERKTENERKRVSTKPAAAH